MTARHEGDIPHVDEVTKRDAQEGKHKYARDDEGTVYHVGVNSWDGSARFERRRTDEEMAARRGAGEPCEECGKEIPFRGIIVIDSTADPEEYYHVRCWSDD